MPRVSTTDICILIPTYNNASSLAVLLESLLERGEKRVIVVNDGSTDETSALLTNFEDRVPKDWKFISYSKNRGKGYALKAGMRLARQSGYMYAVTMDSDGQHRVKDLDTIIRGVLHHPGSLVIGNRDLKGIKRTAGSGFANAMSNFWFMIETLHRPGDTQSGMRAYSLRRLPPFWLVTNRYEAELELLVGSVWRGVELTHVPIDVYYPSPEERVSHFRPIADFCRIFALNIVLCLLAVLYGYWSMLYYALKNRRLFSCEFRPFTRKKGVPKEAPTTLGRLGRSAFGLTFFIFWSVFIFTPLSLVYFSIGKNTEKKKLRFHIALQKVSRFICHHLPGADVNINFDAENRLSTPTVIVCNHQSHLDLPVLMSLSPKLIFLTNDWVWNNFFYGRLIHYAEFLPVSMGFDELIPKLRNLVQNGYSIVVFPEGSRSVDCRIGRFHQGAFMIADALGLEITPLVLHGAGHFLPKRDFMFRRGTISLNALPSISLQQDVPPRQHASDTRRAVTEEYQRMAVNIETAKYFFPLIRYKYSWRGWYTAWRGKKNLKAIGKITEIIDNAPKTGNAVIHGNGIGTFALLYALVNRNVKVTATIRNLKDYGIATATPHIPDNLRFVFVDCEENPKDYESPGVHIINLESEL